MKWDLIKEYKKGPITLKRHVKFWPSQDEANKSAIIQGPWTTSSLLLQGGHSKSGTKNQGFFRVYTGVSEGFSGYYESTNIVTVTVLLMHI